jgi:hypothetical protein
MLIRFGEVACNQASKVKKITILVPFKTAMQSFLSCPPKKNRLFPISWGDHYIYVTYWD